MNINKKGWYINVSGYRYNEHVLSTHAFDVCRNIICHFWAVNTRNGFVFEFLITLYICLDSTGWATLRLKCS